MLIPFLFADTAAGNKLFSAINKTILQVRISITKKMIRIINILYILLLIRSLQLAKR